MKICVFGAGAVGGYLAAHLVATRAADVSIVARGQHLRAIQLNGLRLLEPASEFVAHPVAATERPADLPPQDIVFVALKSTGYAAAAEAIASLVAPGGHVVCVSNGIQWWWNHKLVRLKPDSTDARRRMPASVRTPSAVESAFRRTWLALLDPDGRIWNNIRPERALGCVPYSINEVLQPGVVRHSGNNRWIVGEPDGNTSARLDATIGLLRAAGINAEASTDLRREIWIKLLRNAPLNSLCAVTRLPIDGLAGKPPVMALFNQIIDDIVATARAHGWELQADVVSAAREAPLKGGALEGGRAHGIKPSMLQDRLAGRAMEVESILGVPQAFAREAGVETPALDAVVPLLRGVNRY